MADWPATLPDDWILDGASGAFGDNTLRSQPDVGPPKLRRRSTAMPDRFSGSLLMTTTQIGYLDTFYKTTLGGGSLPFDWLHPVTGASASFNFVGPPQYQPIDGYAAGGEQYWRVHLNLEVLP